MRFIYVLPVERFFFFFKYRVEFYKETINYAGADSGGEEDVREKYKAPVASDC